MKTVKTEDFTQWKKNKKKYFFFHKNILIFYKNGPQKIKPGLTPGSMKGRKNKSIKI